MMVQLDEEKKFGLTQKQNKQYMNMLSKIKHSKVDSKLEKRHNKELKRITQKLSKMHAQYGMDDFAPIRQAHQTQQAHFASKNKHKRSKTQSSFSSILPLKAKEIEEREMRLDLFDQMIGGAQTPNPQPLQDT